MDLSNRSFGRLTGVRGGDARRADGACVGPMVLASGEGSELERITHRFDTFPDPMPSPLVTLTTGPGLAYPGRSAGTAMNLSTNHGVPHR